VRRELILPEDRYGYFRSCHASTITALNRRDYLAAWFAGTFESHADTSIWLCHYVQGEWEPPVEVAKVGPVAHWNPVLFSPGDGEILLFFKVGKTIPGWVTYVCRSTDAGRSWSAPSELVPGDRTGGRGPVKNKPIVLTGGDWLAPGSVETADRWRAFVDLSTDRGRSWTQSNLIGFADESLPGKGVIQPTLWQSGPQCVHMLLRSTCGLICRSDSADGGRTWSPAEATTLPNNNSGIDLTRCPDGRLFLVCNPTDQRAKRTPLSVLTSEDNGLSWRRCVDLEDEDVTVGHLYRLDGGEFSYPSVITNHDELACVYTRHRRQIVCRRAKISELAGEGDAPA